MKRTDIEKIQREQKKKMKKMELEEKKLGDREQKGESYYINELSKLFVHDDKEILNIKYSEEILAIVMDMQENLADKEWDGIFRKSIKRTKIVEKEKAFEELKSLVV